MTLGNKQEKADGAADRAHWSASADLPELDACLPSYLSHLVAELQAALGERFLGAALFGSCARGQAHVGSDVDVLVVVDASDPEMDGLLGLALRNLRRDPSAIAVAALGLEPTPALLVQSLARFGAHPLILLDISSDGRVLHDPRGWIEAHLAAVRKSMAGHGTHRVAQPDGSWYWELKRNMRPGEELSW